MGECLFTAVDPQLRVEVLDLEHAPLLSAEARDEVEEIWSHGLAESGRFDAPIIGFIGLHERVIIAKKTDYKSFYACLRRPELFKETGLVIAVAVSGLVSCRGKWLIGKRSGQVTQYPGCYESVPSGVLDFSTCANGLCDYRLQLQKELMEETGFGPDSVGLLTPFAVVHDLEGHVVDICARIELHPGSADIVPEANAEYEEFYWWDEAELMTHLKLHPEQWVPTSACMLESL